jgi:uncharacterized membrane protein
MGLASSLYLTSIHLAHLRTGAASICNLGSQLNCDLVNTSRFSELAGIPVSHLGSLLYVALLLASLLASRRPGFRARCQPYLLLLVGISVLFSLFLASISAFIPQSARLCIGAIDTDWLSIDPSNVVNIDLTSIGGTSINFQLGGVGPLSQGDPNVPVILGANGLPLPSTLALMGVGLLGLARRLGVRKQPAVD